MIDTKYLNVEAIVNDLLERAELLEVTAERFDYHKRTDFTHTTKHVIERGSFDGRQARVFSFSKYCFDWKEIIGDVLDYTITKITEADIRIRIR